MASASSISAPPTLEMTQSTADRIVRALRHRLLLLHRSGSEFYILGATGNVYIVILSLNPSCTCPDRIAPCKHILFVLIRVLGVSIDDTCLRRRTLRPCQLTRLMNSPTSPDSLATISMREIFQRIFLQCTLTSNPTAVINPMGVINPTGVIVRIEKGTTCPICLDEMGTAQRVVTCATCRNPIHEECFLTWKRSSRRRSTTCVICRARWRNNRSDQDTYLNLSAYVVEDQDVTEASRLCYNN